MSKLFGNKHGYDRLGLYSIGNRLPHALLIEGPKGCGKLSFAGEIAAVALCQDKIDGLPCGICRDCVKIGKMLHPDFLVFGEDANSSKGISVEEVRAIRKEAFVSPSEGQCKVIVLRNLQNLSITAENALLKIIEQPPNGVYFVLTCQNKSSLLPTLLSRLQIITLDNLSIEDCCNAVLSHLPNTHDALAASTAANGSVGVALDILNSSSELNYNQDAAYILSSIISNRVIDGLERFSKFERDKAAVAGIFEEIKLLLEIKISDRKDNINFDQGSLAKISLLQAVKILDIIEEFDNSLKKNAATVLVFTLFCAKTKEALTR